MQVLMLQHGDFFENLQQLFLVKVSLLMNSIVIVLLVTSPNMSGDLVFVPAPSSSWRESVSVISFSHPTSRRKFMRYSTWDRRHGNFCH